jgi:hypothetical protein
MILLRSLRVHDLFLFVRATLWFGLSFLACLHQAEAQGVGHEYHDRYLDPNQRVLEGGLLFRVPFGSSTRSDENFMEVGAYGYLRVNRYVDVKDGLIPDFQSSASLEPAALFRVDLENGRLTQGQLGFGNRLQIDDINITTNPYMLIDRQGRGAVFNSDSVMPRFNGETPPELYGEIVRLLGPVRTAELNDSFSEITASF